MDWKALGNKAAQFLGLLAYGAATAIVSGQIPVDPHLAPWVAIFGGALRTFTDSNALKAS